MAKRTRAHILEDESRAEFSRILPPEWVCRDKNKDYGIDCEIEVFEKDGASTGIVFWVQLKATDSTNNKQSKKVLFKTTKLQQFNSYDLPVLIVRYISSDKSFYFKWANSIIIEENQKNINIEFTDEDLWKEESFKELRHYLHKLSIIKKGNLSFPISISFQNRTSNLTKHKPREFIANLSQAFQSYNSFISTYVNSSNSLFSIEINDLYILVNLCDISKTKLKINLNNTTLSDEYYIALAKMILVNIAICLSRIGCNNLCNNLIYNTKIFEVIKKNEDALICLLPSLFSETDISKILNEIIEYTKQNSDKHNLVQIITQMLLLRKETYNEEELISIKNFLLYQIEWAKSKESKKLIGISFYNLGNHYRSICDYHPAIIAFIQAKKFYSGYKSESYFFTELGGLFHLIDKYKWASEAYKKALKLNGDSNIKALLADSFMYQGLYEQAKILLDKYLLETKSLNNYEWHLKYICLATLIENGWNNTQQRDTIAAQKLVEENKYKEALEKDMLLDIAWFNYGVIQNGKKNNLDATISFTMAALLNPYDIQAWVYATGCSISLKNNHTISIIYYIVNLAYYYNAEKYISALFKDPNFNKLPSNSPIENMIDAIISTSNHHQTKNKLVRIFEDENEC